MTDHIQDLINDINAKYLERDAREERKRFPISPSTLGNCSRQHALALIVGMIYGRTVREHRRRKGD